ncbi:hypothetical protein GCM10009422_08600 [Brevundimonas kwangchunensis]|uniref:Uncharacterized protein n=1 Tax=Brevundimonas kwangchunensis TaxID=322163 RepID=A0ABN1GPH7_9CAUL
MLIASLAFVLSFGLDQAAQTPQAAPAPVTVAQAATPSNPDIRRVCRFETTTGSNRRVRVCRDVDVNAIQDQVTRDFMRDNQRVRLPDGN